METRWYLAIGIVAAALWWYSRQNSTNTSTGPGIAANLASGLEAIGTSLNPLDGVPDNSVLIAPQ